MLGSKRQRARMSKITNDGLARSGTECFIAVSHMATAGIKGLTTANITVFTMHVNDEARLKRIK